MGNIFMHTTEQGDFLSTPFLKCIALSIPSDKVPATWRHSLAPPPPSTLELDIASHQMFNFPLFDVKCYAKYVLPLTPKSTVHKEAAEGRNFGRALVARYR